MQLDAFPGDDKLLPGIVLRFIVFTTWKDEAKSRDAGNNTLLYVLRREQLEKSFTLPKLLSRLVFRCQAVIRPPRGLSSRHVSVLAPVLFLPSPCPA